MTRSTVRPLYNDTSEKETTLRIHREVEHRESELAVFILDDEGTTTDSTAERPAPSP